MSAWEKHPGDYPRSGDLWEKDEWSRGKIYYEYGWQSDKTKEEQEATQLKSHHFQKASDLEGSSWNHPIHPAEVKYILKIRHITDWSAKEQDDLHKFIIKKLDDHDLEYKGADEYTPDEVALWMSCVDYAEHKRMMMTSQVNGMLTKDAWICRICKQCYIATADTSVQGQDWGHNPAPLYPTEQKVCSGCNGNFVMAARMGAKKEDFIFPAGQHWSPFFYPKPADYEDIQTNLEDERGTFIVSCEGPAFDPPLLADQKIEWLEQVHTCDKAQIGKLMELLKQTRAQGRGFGGNDIKKAFADGQSSVREECLADLKKAQELEEAATELMVANHQESAELRARSGEARKTLARIKEGNAPKIAKIKALKKEVADRDEVIAEYKQMAGFIKQLPLETIWQMTMSSLRHKIAPVESAPDINQQMGVVAPGIDEITRTEYLEEQRLKAKAEEEHKAHIQAQQRKKKKTHHTRCQYCSEPTPTKSMVDNHGDLVCRPCSQ